MAACLACCAASPLLIMVTWKKKKKKNYLVDSHNLCLLQRSSNHPTGGSTNNSCSALDAQSRPPRHDSRSLTVGPSLSRKGQVWYYLSSSLSDPVVIPGGPGFEPAGPIYRSAVRATSVCYTAAGQQLSSVRGGLRSLQSHTMLSKLSVGITLLRERSSSW